jgi:hypothetical protein
MEHELQHAMFEVPDSFDVHTVLMDGDIDTGKLLYVVGWGGGKGRRRCDRMGEGCDDGKLGGSCVWADVCPWLCGWCSVKEIRGEETFEDVRAKKQDIVIPMVSTDLHRPMRLLWVRTLNKEAAFHRPQSRLMWMIYWKPSA